MALTARRIRFVQEYCTSWNAADAARKAGYAEETARAEGSFLLTIPDVQRAIKKRLAELSEAASLDAIFVLNQWKKIATADANDLIQLRRTCCRACHGVGHHYQWMQSEFTMAMQKALDTKTDPPINAGGFGYDATLAPHKECPECLGEGIEQVYITDTRKLKGSAKLLYAGVHKTKDGVRVLMRDQDKALENIAKYLGMAGDKITDTDVGKPPADIKSGLNHFYGGINIFNNGPADPPAESKDEPSGN